MEMRASLEASFPTRVRPKIAKWICAYVSVLFIAFVFAPAFFIDNLEILLPSFVAVAIFLYFVSRLRLQIQDNIFGEIGFVYLAFATAYTVFPAYGFLTLESLASGTGFDKLALLSPDPAQLGLHLWRHVLFIAAVASGYLLFRGRNKVTFSSVGSFCYAEKPIICFLFLAVVVSVIALWSLSAPVHEYLDYYTRYDHLPWIGKRALMIFSVVKTGGTFVLLTIMFRNYRTYRFYAWLFVLLRVVQEILASLGARIDAFMILVAAALLYHAYVKRITLRKGLLATLALGLIFSVVEIARFSVPDTSGLEETTLQGRGMPAAELGAVFVPGFHLYAERASGTLPPVEWQVFFNDFVSLVPVVDQTKWSPMYWYAAIYFPDAVVPPMTLGPIAMSALLGGEIGLFALGLCNGILFAFLMRWFATGGRSWQVTTIYVFCYSSCIMCLKYSVFWHLTPVVKGVLPVVVIVSLLAKAVPLSTKLARVVSPA
jgi:hypothetical protein